MKKLSITIAILLLSMSINAQYHAKVEVGAGLGLDKRSAYTYGANAVYNITPSIGIGVGFEKTATHLEDYTTNNLVRTSLPLFGRLEYDFRKEGNTPYVSIDFGYYFEIQSEFEEMPIDVFISPSFGQKIGRVYYAAYLNIQRIKHEYPTHKANKWSSFLGIKFGVNI